MTIRPPAPDDATAIANIVASHNLPAAWAWPEGEHGIVVEAHGAVRAFCVLKETIYGLVIDELWEERTRTGFRALSLLHERIEEIAQDLADRRGEPIQVGGLVVLERTAHKNALQRRGYTVEAEVLAKLVTPSTTKAQHNDLSVAV